MQRDKLNAIATPPHLQSDASLHSPRLPLITLTQPRLRTSKWNIKRNSWLEIRISKCIKISFGAFYPLGIKQESKNSIFISHCSSFKSKYQEHCLMNMRFKVMILILAVVMTSGPVGPKKMTCTCSNQAPAKHGYCVSWQCEDQQTDVGLVVTIISGVWGLIVGIVALSAFYFLGKDRGWWMTGEQSLGTMCVNCSTAISATICCTEPRPQQQVQQNQHFFQSERPSEAVARVPSQVVRNTCPCHPPVNN